MTFAQWIIDTTEAGMLAAIDPVSPIHGSGSLQLGRGAASGSDLSICVSPGPTLPQAFTGGRARHLFRVDAHSGSSYSHVGLLALKSQRDLTAGAGAAYGWLARSTASGWGAGGGASLALVKYSAGIGQTLGGILLTAEVDVSAAGFVDPLLGVVFALELEWLVDLATLGGTRLIGRYGADFASLTDVVTLVDTTSPLTETVGEGPMLFCNSTGSITAAIDRTRQRRVLSTTL